MRSKLIALVIVIFALSTFSFALATEGPSMMFYNPEGMWDNEFFVSHAVYVSGTGFDPDTDYSIYIVPHQEWVEGMTIPEAVEGTVGLITSDSNGEFSTIVWEPYLTCGHYDAILDMNENGEYNSEIDLTDEMRVFYSAGVQHPKKPIPDFHVPELPFGTILGLLTFLLALSIYRRGLNIPYFK